MFSEIMSELLKTNPKKSILKKRPSIDKTASETSLKHQHYDEQNVKETYGPGLENKDYGNMKIDEPNTPFERSVLEDEDNSENPEKINLEINDNSSSAKKSYDYEPPVQNTNVCPDELESKLAHVSKRQQTRRVSTSSANDDESDEDTHLTAEEIVKKKKFENARKAHYNMKEQMLRARQLMEEEDEDEDDE